MTAYAATCLWLLKESTEYVFWLGMAAHAHIAIAITGLMGLLVKRSLKVNKSGIEIVDHKLSDLVRREDVEEAIEETPTVVQDKYERIS